MPPSAPLHANRSGWKVLLVDDETDVHEMSRLILANLQFEGRAVELISAGSAAQARDLLRLHPDIALALLDVVMESDDAGLALVHYIRDQLHDLDMQVVLRTGQPGVAPEADIMRRYEINGYYLKTEITAQRLHSIVISGLRGYRHAQGMRGLAGAARVDTRVNKRGPAQPALSMELAALDEAESVLLQVQPEVALSTNQVVGVELVPYWRTSMGLLPASRVAEACPEGPVMERMAHWMLGQACGWASTWASSMPQPLKVSIPMVGEWLARCDALDALLQAVRTSNLPPGTLDLLVSESTLQTCDPQVRAMAAGLRSAGVSLTMVDFGARTISLQGLNLLVPDRLKIHRLFVRGVANEPERMALARSLIALAQTLNIVSIADGISCDADTQFFKWEGCDLGQGDGLAPACAPADLAAYMQHGPLAAH